MEVPVRRLTESEAECGGALWLPAGQLARRVLVPDRKAAGGWRRRRRRQQHGGVRDELRLLRGELETRARVAPATPDAPSTRAPLAPRRPRTSVGPSRAARPGCRAGR